MDNLKSEQIAKSQILFDGNCIICDLEIMHYKRIAPDLFECVDISKPDFQAQSYGLTKAAVDKDMHVLTPAGQLVIGVDAFAHIWERLGEQREGAQPMGQGKWYFRFMSRAIRLPVLYPCARVSYSFFTIIRPYLPKKSR